MNNKEEIIIKLDKEDIYIIYNSITYYRKYLNFNKDLRKEKDYMLYLEYEERKLDKVLNKIRKEFNNK